MTPWNENRLTAMLGIKYPIIQGPLGGLSSQRLAAIVSNGGGLGSFGAHTLTPGAIGETAAQVRALTSRPFAVNLWVSMEDPGARESNARSFEQSLSPITTFLRELGAPTPAYQDYNPASFDDQARAVLQAKVPVFSFIFGVPPVELLKQCRSLGIVTIGTATTVDEAVALEGAGLDAIVASGFEAGGHRGAFLGRAEDSLIGTMSLVPQVVDAVEVPVIAAGGIADARGVIAALALGAEGVQIGTAFLASEESGANPLHRAALRGPAARDTGLTRGFSGRLARGIRNKLMEELNREGTLILPYPLQRALIKNVAVAAEQAGRPDLMPLWAGQSAGIPSNPDAAAFLTSLIEEVSAAVDPRHLVRGNGGRSAG
jgi:nitronate monooxygenase